MDSSLSALSHRNFFFQTHYVIDFINFHWDAHYFPAFNVADSAITIGAALLLLDAWLEAR